MMSTAELLAEIEAEGNALAAKTRAFRERFLNLMLDLGPLMQNAQAIGDKLLQLPPGMLSIAQREELLASVDELRALGLRLAGALN